jgi:hypothetical protein
VTNRAAGGWASALAESWNRGRLWARSRAVLTSTPFLGVVVALASWNVSAFGAPGIGLDTSWQTGLYMGTHQGLEFGSQIAWTYGPLGFLDVPLIVYDDLSSLQFVYSSMLHVVFALSLVWVLRPRFGATIAVVATFLTSIVFSPIDSMLVLAALWCFAALSEDAPPFARWLVVFGGGAVAAVEVLTKLNPGLPVAGLVAITICAMNGRQRKWNIPLFAGTFAVTVSALWVASGQGLGNVGDYARVSTQIVSGYSQAMGAEGSGLEWQVPAGAVAIGILVFSTLAPTRDLPWSRRMVLLLMLGVILFPLYKVGFVRHDDNHAAIFFSTSFGIGIAVLPTLERRWIAAPAIAVLAALAVPALPEGSSVNFDPIGHLRTLEQQTRTLIDPKKRDYLAGVARALMTDTYRLDRRTLDLLRGRTVHVDPWEAGVAWAYRLDWDPLPLFQDYGAYTTELDEANGQALESPSGPERVLRENTALVDPSYPAPTIDGRYPAWDPPAAAVSMLCNFEALRSTRRWQVLGRVSDRCGPRRLIRSVDTRFGATIEVPKPHGRDEVVIAAIHGAGVAGAESLRTLVYRATSRYVVINGAQRYRLVPGTAADGLLVNTPSSVDFPAPFSLGPHARTIRLTKDDSQDPLEVDFYAIHVRPEKRGF